MSPLKGRVCGCGLNRFVHEGMNHISNVKVHLKTHSGNVNIFSTTTDCTLIMFITSPFYIEVKSKKKKHLSKTRNANFSFSVYYYYKYIFFYILFYSTTNKTGCIQRLEINK